MKGQPAFEKLKSIVYSPKNERHNDQRKKIGTCVYALLFRLPSDNLWCLFQYYHQHIKGNPEPKGFKHADVIGAYDYCVLYRSL